MDYNEAMSFLEDIKKYGSRLGLDSIRALMGQLGDVQDWLQIIHIGGTNGKGSVGAYLSSVFAASGYRVGWFNTPDVFSYEEEFRLGGVPIEKDRLAEIFTEVKDACDRLTATGLPHPTRFEVETAAAFLWFYEEGCDLAIIEVGMGGETDATNIIKKPLVSVLTSVSMDHMRFLGESLKEIAAVKAGIIKPGCPVVTVAQEPAVMEVIEERSREQGSEFYIAEEGILSGYFRSNIKKIIGKSDLNLGLSGNFQRENAACALAVINLLREKYPQITDETISIGMKNARWPGRYERISTHPDIYLDGAHNEGAARRLRESLDADFPGRRILYVMGVLADKDYERIAGIMFSPGDRVYTLAPDNSRALDAADLAEYLKSRNVDAVPCANAADAVSYVLEEAQSEDVILAFGSLSYLSDIKKAFTEAIK